MMIEEKLKIWHQKASLLIFFDTFPNKISYLNSFISHNSVEQNKKNLTSGW